MTANVNIEIARRTNVLRVPNAALRFRPTQGHLRRPATRPMPPELQRGFGGRGGRGGQQNGQNGAAATPGSGGAAPQPPMRSRLSQVSRQPRPEQRAPRAGAVSRRRTAQRTATRQGSSRGGGRGGFANMTPEERQKRMDERMASMSPEERAAVPAADEGPPGPRRRRPGRRRRGRSGGSRQPHVIRRRQRGRPDAQMAARPTTQVPAMARRRPSIRCLRRCRWSRRRGRVWTYINKQLKSIALRLGITDGTYTEVLNDTELPVGTEVVTNFITPAMATPRRRQAQQRRTATR